MIKLTSSLKIFLILSIFVGNALALPLSDTHIKQLDKDKNVKTTITLGATSTNSEGVVSGADTLPITAIEKQNIFQLLGKFKGVDASGAPLQKTATPAGYYYAVDEVVVKSILNVVNPAQFSISLINTKDIKNPARVRWDQSYGVQVRILTSQGTNGAVNYGNLTGTDRTNVLKYNTLSAANKTKYKPYVYCSLFRELHSLEMNAMVPNGTDMNQIAQDGSTGTGDVGEDLGEDETEVGATGGPGGDSDDGSTLVDPDFSKSTDNPNSIDMRTAATYNISTVYAYGYTSAGAPYSQDTRLNVWKLQTFFSTDFPEFSTIRQLGVSPTVSPYFVYVMPTAHDNAASGTYKTNAAVFFGNSESPFNMEEFKGDLTALPSIRVTVSNAYPQAQIKFIVKNLDDNTQKEEVLFDNYKNADASVVNAGNQSVEPVNIPYDDAKVIALSSMIPKEGNYLFLIDVLTPNNGPNGGEGHEIWEIAGSVADPIEIDTDVRVENMTIIQKK